MSDFGIVDTSEESVIREMDYSKSYEYQMSLKKPSFYHKYGMNSFERINDRIRAELEDHRDRRFPTKQLKDLTHFFEDKSFHEGEVYYIFGYRYIPPPHVTIVMPTPTIASAFEPPEESREKNMKKLRAIKL